MFKLIVIGLMILALLIPLAMIGSTVSERANRLQEAERSVASSWGLSQTLSGPVLTVPFRVHHKNEDDETITFIRKARFFPADLDVRGELEPELRRRGIFEVAVYQADVLVSGHFDTPDFAALRIAPQDVVWEEITIDLGLTDLRGIRNDVSLTWNDVQTTFEPAGRLSGLWDAGLRATLPPPGDGEPNASPSDRDYDEWVRGLAGGFSIDLALNGSRKLSVVPSGATTTVELDSSWNNPSFSGAFLPQEHNLTERGFSARWSVPYYGRNFPQTWIEGPGRPEVSCCELLESAFGVDLMLTVDTYQKTERARKYGVLFLVLTFLTFFLFEIFNPLRLHPLHYLLVGSALTLFFLVLLSLAEHIPFGFAYGIASAITVGLIGGYCATILKGRRRAMVVTVVLAALYGYLFVLLRLQDYALLLGSLALVAILALVMWVTRKVDWYGGAPSVASSTGAVP